VNVSEAQNALLPSALANRMKELVEQSKRCHTDSARIRAEIEELHQQIAALRSEDLPGSATPGTPLRRFYPRD
jgi:anti-sigma factor RsiW